MPVSLVGLVLHDKLINCSSGSVHIKGWVDRNTESRNFVFKWGGASKDHFQPFPKLMSVAF